MNVPVLIVIFNRPDKFRMLIDALREVRPNKIFISADGPRPGRTDDMTQCAQARKMAEAIDWPCDVATRFLDDNMGCDPHVASAIGWFFESVDCGIIFEDDVIPHPDFFRFCDELFERYRHDERIMQISSISPYDKRNHPYSYHFSRYFRCHGAWGTWKRAWLSHAIPKEQYDTHDVPEIIRACFPKPVDQRYWMRLFREFMDGSRVNWDYWWHFACYAQNGLCIVPESNFAKNVGYDEHATHTKRQEPVFCDLEIEPMPFPLTHPPFVFADERPEINFRKNYFGRLGFKSRLSKHIKSLYWSFRDYGERLVRNELL